MFIKRDIKQVKPRLSSNFSRHQQRIVAEELLLLNLFNQITQSHDIKGMLDLLPYGISIVTNKSREIVIHNAMSSEFLRIQTWGEVFHSAGELSPIEILSNGQQILIEEMPIQRAALNGETIIGVELEFVWPDGVRKFGSWSALPLYRQGIIYGAMAIFIDISEKKKCESEMLRLERLNAIGEMAASIAHEIRNPLTTVRGYLQMFQHKSEYIKHREQFTTMIEELDRGNFIISEFLSLSKDKEIGLRPCCLKNVLNPLMPLLKADALLLGHEFHVKLEDIPDINLDAMEIRQLLLNLVRNGFEAMSPGGTLTIHSYIDTGNAMLVVRDTGHGIPRAVLEKLGTPFQTTKENGTGLGLVVCYRIAKRHGATIDVKTSSKGTSFLVKFRI